MYYTRLMYQEMFGKGINITVTMISLNDVNLDITTAAGVVVG